MIMFVDVGNVPARESSPTLRHSRVNSRTHSVGMGDAMDGVTDQS